MRYLLFFISFFICRQSFCQRPIDAREIISIGGIKQYVWIKGQDDSKLILLFLHGGPGGSLMRNADKITARLQQHFIVVQWDQRETGETLKLNKSQQPLSLQLFYNDTHDLIDTLLKRYQKTKLYLVGYSWGTGMGFYVADKYPELLYAYIAISPVINQARADSLSLEMLKNEMGNKARKELASVKIPFENADQLYYHRKWLYKYEGQKFVSFSLRKAFVQSWAATWFDVWSRSCEVNLFKTLPAIRCPVYFFAGGKDFNTHHVVTKEYYNYLIAPKKDLFVFEQAGHGLLETRYDRFQDVMIKTILPATSDERH